MFTVFPIKNRVKRQLLISDFIGWNVWHEDQDGTSADRGVDRLKPGSLRDVRKSAHQPTVKYQAHGGK